MAGPHQPIGLPDSDLPHQKYMYVCMYFPRGTLITSTTQNWVVTHYQHGISALISQVSCGETISGTPFKIDFYSVLKEPCHSVILIVLGKWSSCFLLTYM